MIAAQGILTTPRRQDLARRRGRPRHGQDLRLRRRRHRRGRRTATRSPSDGTTVERGRRHLHRRHHRQGLPRRGAGRSRRRWCSTSRATLAADADPLVAAVHRLLTPRRRARGGCGCGPTPTPRDGRRPGPPVRRRGHRPVPHRAHVPRRPARAGRAADPGRRPTTSARPRSTALLPLQRADFVEHLPRDGRPAGHGPADRPAAARVPAAAGGAGGQGRRGRGDAARTRATTRRCSPRSAGCTSRTRCSACAASGSGWSSPACSRCRSGRSPRPPRRCRPSGGDPRPEIMVPLVGAVQELETVRAEAEQCSPRWPRDAASRSLIGTMIEVPRAALTAGRDRRGGASSSPSAPTT